ncbi:MAG: hypothetical protein KAG64_02645 [Bacteroidales bacterium]|nr:hypothetical protein [Bacteroidales bacterium]
MKPVIILILSLFVINIASAQIRYDGKLGNGLQLKTKDNSFYLKYRTRIQTRWDFEYDPTTTVLQNRAYVKRARLKFNGYFVNKNLRYKIEYDVVGGYVRDATIKYRMGNFDLWFGQAKLPTNRERVVSSGDLQFVDRSIYNKYYTLDRDVGIQLHHHFYLGKVLIRDIYAISSGDGILDNRMSEGLSYSGKLEVLPFGKFTKKGDYKFADLDREPKPKLSFAAYASFNKSAYKSRGQIGVDLSSKADLLLMGADLFFKFKGYSFLIEVGQRLVTDGGVFVYDEFGNITGQYYTGWGMNVQTGYVLASNWEFSGRYATTVPEDLFRYSNKEMEDFTVGISKYIIEHNFKIQADFTFRQTVEFRWADNNTYSNAYIGRIQLEFQF